MNELPDLYTYLEAAAVAKVTVRTVERRVADETLERVYLGPNETTPRITGESLRKWVMERPPARVRVLATNSPTGRS